MTCTGQHMFVNSRSLWQKRQLKLYKNFKKLTFGRIAHTYDRKSVTGYDLPLFLEKCDAMHQVQILSLQGFSLGVIHNEIHGAPASLGLSI